MDYVIKEYCVYTHRDMNGKVFYVGSGTRERPFDFRSRSEKWCTHVAAYGLSEVKIICLFATRKEAYEHETETTKLLIDMGVKLANTSIGTKHADETKKKIGAVQNCRLGGATNSFKGIWIGLRCVDSAIIAFSDTGDIITRRHNPSTISAASRGVYCGWRGEYKGCTWTKTLDKEYLRALLEQDNFVDAASKAVLINFIG